MGFVKRGQGQSERSRFPSGSISERTLDGSTLINNENLHEGQYLERSPKLTEAISPVVDLLRKTLARGAAAEDFRKDVDALDFYVTLAAMGYYLVSNRFTLKAFVGRDYTEPSAIDAVSAMQVEMLLSYLRPALKKAAPDAAAAQRGH
jgi:hypothetical protein